MKKFNLLLFLLIHDGLAYNLIEEAESTYIIPQNNSIDLDKSMFGWATVFTKNDMFISAPETLQSKGTVYKCGKNSKKCTPIEVIFKGEDNNGMGFGTILLANDKGAVYACAPRTNQPIIREGNRRMGTCYRYSKDKNIFEQQFDLNTSLNDGISRNQLYTKVGPLGMTATFGDDNHLYVGLPYSRQLRYPNQASMYSGTVIKCTIDNRNQRTIHFPSKTTNEPPFKFEQFETRNQFPQDVLIGYHVTKGKFTNSEERELIIGAPGDLDLKGSVYITQVKNGQYPPLDRQSKLKSDYVAKVNGVRAGEGFGQVSIACDINGDGKDELMIGAPFYAKDKNYYDTGRVHVFFNNWNKEKGRKINLARSRTIGDFQYKLGAQFGKSLACLGDTDGDGNEELVVGAPFYRTENYVGGSSGAIFIFKNFLNAADDKTKPSQTILGKTRGFGFSFALPDLIQDNVCFSAESCPRNENELAISSPVDNTVYVHRFRKVVRFKATTVESLHCKSRDGSKLICSTSNLDPKAEGLTLKIFPKLIEAVSNSDIFLTIKVQVGFRVNFADQTKESVFENVILQGEKEPQEEIRFELIKSDRWSNNFTSPEACVVIRYSIQYSLPCDTENPGLCNMFPMASELLETNLKRTSDISLVTKEKTLKPTLQACNVGKCDCTTFVQLQSQIGNKPIVLQKKIDKIVGFVKIYKNGKDIAHSNKIVMKLSSENNTDLSKNLKIMDRRDSRISEDCKTVGETVECNLRNLEKDGDSMAVNISIILKSTDFIDDKKVIIEVEAQSSCKELGFLGDSKLPVNFLTQWKINSKPSKEEIIEYDDSTPPESKKVLSNRKQILEIQNLGPSRSIRSEIFVFVPGHKLIGKVVNVSLGNKQCLEKGDKKLLLIPPQAKLSDRPGRQKIQCQTRVECDPFLCMLEPLNPSTPTELVVSVEFDMDGVIDSDYDFYSIVIGVIMSDSDGKKITGTKTLSYIYNRVTLLQMALDKYDWIMGFVFGLVIIIIISLIFKQFDLFNRVRLYKDVIPDAAITGDNIKDDPIPLYDTENVTLRK